MKSVHKLGEIVNSNEQVSYLKSLSKVEKFINLYKKEDKAFQEEKHVGSLMSL